MCYKYTCMLSVLQLNEMLDSLLPRRVCNHFHGGEPAHFSHLQIKHLAVVLTRTNNTAEYIAENPFSVHFMAYYLLYNNRPLGMFRCGGHPREKTRLRGHPREKTRLRGQGLEVNHPRENEPVRWRWDVAGKQCYDPVTGVFNLLH